MQLINGSLLLGEMSVKYIMASLVILGTLTACGGGGSDTGNSTAGTLGGSAATNTVPTTTTTPASTSTSPSTPSAASTPLPPTTAGNDNGGATVETLQISARVNGVAVSGYPASTAQLPAINLTSGQELEISSSMPTISEVSLNGAIAAVRTNTATTYKAVLAASTDTTGTLTFSTTAGPLQTMTVPLTVRAAEFQPVVPKVGDTLIYRETATLANNSAYAFDSTTQRVTTVNPDGSWLESYLTSAGALIGTATYNSHGNRTSFLTDASSAQNCDDRGSRLTRFSPEEKLVAFPLAVGITFTSAWKTTCGTDTTQTNSQDESISARVIGYEVVTTPAGVFNALRIDEVTTVTNSTNVLLPGGGYRQTVSVWFDPVLGRRVKHSGTRTYAGTLTAAQAAVLVQTSTAELVSFAKN
jgi:hypothetical protein